MIGLEYICKLENKTYTELADYINISKQVINSWVKGRRKIPQKYLDLLQYVFNIPNEYFQKELTPIDKLKVQELILLDGYQKLGYTEYAEKIKLKKMEEYKYGEDKYFLEKISEGIIAKEEKGWKAYEEKLGEDIKEFSNDKIGLANRFIKILKNTHIKTSILDGILTGIEKYENNQTKVTNFSLYIFNLIKFEVERLEDEGEEEKTFESEIIKSRESRNYLTYTEMNCEGVIHDYEKAKLDIYREIKLIIGRCKTTNNAQSDNLISVDMVVELYRMLTILIKYSNTKIRIGTIYSMLKGLIEVYDKYEYYKPFPYSKNPVENFKNKIMRIILKREKELDAEEKILFNDKFY